jgi:hypothetical protein
VDPKELDDARQTLTRIEERLRRDVGDMVRVLQADVPAFFVRAVRRVFEQAPEADALDPAAVRRLKEDTLATGKALGAEVARRLEPFEVWTWDPTWAKLPAEPLEDLDRHPRVSGRWPGSARPSRSSWRGTGSRRARSAMRRAIGSPPTSWRATS